MYSDEGVTLVLVESGESLSGVAERIPAEVQGVLLIVFPRAWEQGTVRSREEFLEALSRRKTSRVVLMTADAFLQEEARSHSITTVQRRADLRSLCSGHPLEIQRALQHFSIFPWQQVLEDAWRRITRLSVNRVRVWILLGASSVLFLSVLAVALPSATIRVWPRVTLINHTANVLLIASGSTVEHDRGQNVLELIPVAVTVERSFAFDQISKNFTGKNAEVLMTLVNESEDPYTIRTGTRLVNQAGMIFKTLAPVGIPPASGIEPGTVTVQARAEPEDIFGEVVGERGNVPAGIRWDFPGLTRMERDKVYARNVEEAKGGFTEYGTLVQEKDLALAKVQITEELLRAAKVRVEEEIENIKARTGRTIVLFAGSQYDVLTRTTYSGVTVPTNLIGQPLTSIPVEGELLYTMLAYDKDALTEILEKGLRSHVEEGYELVPGSAMRDRVAVYVIEYDDNLTWVKVTGDLTAEQRAILSPLSSAGRLFAERLRGMVQGKSREEALRIIQNFSDVDQVELSLWPPWQDTLPTLFNHIAIIPQES